MAWCVAAVVAVLLITNAAARETTVVVERIVAWPEPNATEAILLRNKGTEAVSLEGWTITDSRKDSSDESAVVFFGRPRRSCASVNAIPPNGVLELKPKTEDNPCGFPFGISNADQLHVFDGEGEQISYVEWGWSLPGLSFRRKGNGDYDYVKEDQPVAPIMEEREDLFLFVQALQAVGEWETVWRRSVVTWSTFSFSSNLLIPFQLPSSFDRKQDQEEVMDRFKDEWPRSEAIFPSPGRLTVLCPSNAAMRRFYRSGILGSDLSPEEIRQLPEFREIVKFHILPGEWTSGFLIDGIDIRTSVPDANITVMRDPENGGDVFFGSDCRDRSGNRDDCPCRGPCGKIIETDFYAANGVLHVIDTVLLPPSIARTALLEEERSEEDETQDSQEMDELLLELVEFYDDPAAEDEL